MNVLAHLYGHKRVTLFSPDQTPLLYPENTVPYEDGLYSKVNDFEPDLEQHSSSIHLAPQPHGHYQRI